MRSNTSPIPGPIPVQFRYNSGPKWTRYRYKFCDKINFEEIENDENISKEGNSSNSETSEVEEMAQEQKPELNPLRLQAIAAQLNQINPLYQRYSFSLTHKIHPKFGLPYSINLYLKYYILVAKWIGTQIRRSFWVLTWMDIQT